MRRVLFFISGIFLFINGFAQNPATVFTIPNRNIDLPCGASCTPITVQVPHIKGTNGYVITNPGYVPFNYTTPSGNEVTQIYIDDTWSPVISPGFNFCFYGSNYSSLIMGSNSAITFDISRAGTGSGYSISSTTGAIPNSTYAPSMIFGPYHDINPNISSPNKKIEWRVEGTAPQRRFIASYNDMPFFGSSCTVPRATHQMVLYESTGIVEVYIKDKPFCTAWNSGLAILGMQDQSRTNAIAAPGKNATVWGTTGMDSCFRFIPTSGASRFKSAVLEVNGTVVATADTSTLSPGVLNLNFPNVCPTLDSTAYVIRVKYVDCIGDPLQDVIFTDTVFVKKGLGPDITVAKTDASCSANGTITVTVTGGQQGPFEYSINGGATYQSSNIFNNVAPGNYNVIARVVGTTCPSAIQQVTITLINTLSITVTKTDADCNGGSITITPSGGTSPYQYSINGGTTYQSGNTFNSLAGGTYNVVVRDASNCTASQSITLSFTNNLNVSANQQSSICNGAGYTPNFTSNGTTYSWSPTTGVSNPSILNPVLSPQTSTTYTLTVQLGSCTATRTVTMNVAPGASVNAGQDATIIAGDTYQIQATGSAGTFLWTPSVGLNSTSTLAPVASPQATTTYTLSVTTPLGCIATDDLTITVVPYCVKPMNAFTPNGDGINDLWLITNGNCLVKARAQVFNRYGNKVFESNDYKNTWNGTYKGKPVADGTYYYVIDFNLINGKAVVLKGNLTILR